MIIVRNNNNEDSIMALWRWCAFDIWYFGTLWDACFDILAHFDQP